VNSPNRGPKTVRVRTSCTVTLSLSVRALFAQKNGSLWMKFCQPVGSPRGYRRVNVLLRCGGRSRRHSWAQSASLHRARDLVRGAPGGNGYLASSAGSATMGWPNGRSHLRFSSSALPHTFALGFRTRGTAGGRSRLLRLGGNRVCGSTLVPRYRPLTGAQKLMAMAAGYRTASRESNA